MTADNKYPALITSEHQKTDFKAVVAALTQGHADNQAILVNLSSYFDLDLAVGVQLDAVGIWIGITRYLQVPLTGVYFSLDIYPGLDQGTLQGLFDPTTGLTVLPDDTYRVLLKFKAAANNWDGTIPGAYTIFATLQPITGATLLIQDEPGMTMIFAIFGVIPNAVVAALFAEGELLFKSAGVHVLLMLPDDALDPYFGLDAENAMIAGLDVGAFGTVSGEF